MKKVILAVCLAGLLVFPAVSTAQQDQETSFVMDDMVVTATRHEQKTEKIPAQVTVITADAIRKSGAQSVPDVLRSVGGVYVTDLNGNGNNQTVDMGGFGETANRHVAVLLNGRRINPIDQASIRWAAIAVENIERIEVLHGSGSVLYGDNAMGGVINIITKAWDGEKHLNVEVSGGSHITRKGHMDMSLGDARKNIQLGVTQFQTDGYRDRSAADRQNVYGRFHVDASDGLSIFGEANLIQADYQLPGSLTETQYNQDRRQAANLNDQGSDADGSVMLGFDAQIGSSGLMTVNVSHRGEQRDSDMASWWSYYTYDIETNAATAKYILNAPLASRENRLTVGIDYYDTKYDALGGGFKGATTNHYFFRRQATSLYAQDEIAVIEDVYVNLGARYESPDLDLRSELAAGTSDKSIDDAEHAWNLGVSWAFKPGSKAYARIYRSFRYPVVDEYMVLWSGAVNDDLEPETSTGYEAGARLTLTRKLVANLRAFVMDVNDEIYWNNSTGQNENFSETRHTGGSIDIRYAALDWLTLFGNAGFTEAEFTTGTNDGKKIPLVPDWKGNAGAEFNFDFGLDLRIQGNYVGEKYFGGDEANAGKKMDSYTTMDFYASQQFDHWEFFLNATNVFSEEYSDAGYNYGAYTYYPAAEAVYFGGIRLKF